MRNRKRENEKMNALTLLIKETTYVYNVPAIAYSLVVRLTLMCGEVGNPGFKPRPLHIISLVATN
ncbi:hypothetical protein MTR_6g059990 [Medicago truncatula]|uniref:Uncharacterized protein n=1 Tax=Medicago truncatula TaxID=3880 RepID=G7KMW9_MEDTR|nr:hypothetical protein MTR_6g059990 [Medicago truncatula]